MPQSETVARALLLQVITESTWVVPSCQCLTLRTVTGRREGGTGRHWAAACWGGGGGGRRGHGRPRSERRARRGAPRRSWGWEHNAGDSTGIVPVSPAGNSEVFRVLIPCGSGRELDSAVEKRIWVKNCWVEFKSNTFASLLLRIRF